MPDDIKHACAPRAATNPARRRFIVRSAASGGFALGFFVPGFPMLAEAASRRSSSGSGSTTPPPTSSTPPPSSPTPPPDSPVPAGPATTTPVNAWIRIGSDESVTILVGSSEMGQGVISSLPQIVAEELMVDWEKIRSEHAPPAPSYVNPVTRSQLTGGSMSVRGYYTALRRAGAAAREMLILAGAANMRVAASECRAVHGSVVHSSGRSVTYGTVAAAAAAYTPPTDPPLVPDAQLKMIGQSLPRLDIGPKVDGSAIYGIDVRLDGMLYAAIRHCPSFGGTVLATPSTPSGAIAVVNLGNAVAVVAKDTWSAMRAARRASVRWTLPPTVADIDTAKIFAQAQQLMDAGAPLLTRDAAEVTGALAGADPALTLDATYDVPYLAHACMEPLNCTVRVTSTRCEVWAPTQAPGMVLATVKALTGMTDAQITVNTTFLGGGLGRKFEQDYIAQAVKVAMAPGVIGKPVKLTWSREEDFQHDQYRPMALSRVRAALGADGRIAAWSNRIVTPSILGQRRWLGPGQVDSQAVDGAIDLPYAMALKRVEWVPHPAAVPVGFWRSVGHSINAFVVESAIDELALLARADPYEFRRGMLSGRYLDVLDAAAALGGWGTPLPSGRARGIALAEGFGSIVAQVAEVSQSAPGVIRVHRISCAIDCGRVINPDNVKAQMEGGIVHGLTAALWGRMTFANGVASPTNFNGYRMLKLREMPRVDVALVPGSDVPGGVGEPGVPPVAPAVANAWAALTRQRLRSLPLFPAQIGVGGDD